MIIYKCSKTRKQHRPSLKAKGQASFGTQQLLAAGGASPGGCRCLPRPGDGDESAAVRGLFQEAARRVKSDQTAPGTSVIGAGRAAGEDKTRCWKQGVRTEPLGEMSSELRRRRQQSDTEVHLKPVPGLC